MTRAELKTLHRVEIGSAALQQECARVRWAFERRSPCRRRGTNDDGWRRFRVLAVVDDFSRECLDVREP